MKFIERREMFEETLALASNVIDLKAKLPDQVFRNEIQEFLFIDVDEVFTEEFYGRMNKFVGSVDESTWYFLDPDPWKPFLDSGKYPAFEITTNDLYEDYWQIVSQGPSKGTDYAFFYAGTSRFILFSRSLRWCVLVDRNFEMGIAGFRNNDLAERFRTAFGGENVYNLEDAVDMFVFPGITSFMSFGGRQSLLKTLLNNYGQFYDRK